MSIADSKKKGISIGLIVILVVLVLLTGIQIFFSFYLDTYAENRLTSMGSEQSGGQYTLKMDELDVSVWGRSFEMENIRLHPTDTSSTAPKIDLDEFSVTGIRFLPYLFNGRIEVGEIQLTKPHINVVQDSPDSLTFLKPSGSTSSGKTESPVIEAEQFKIDNASVNYWKADQSEMRGEVHDFNFSVSDVRVDSASLAQVPYLNFSDIKTSSGKSNMN